MIHKIPTNQTLVDGKNFKPDDVIVLSGTYPVTPYFKNLSEVMITNEGPVSLLSGLKFDNCREWTITGNRKDPFRLTEPKAGASGIAVYNRSSDFEIAYLIIENCGFAGIMAKDDGAKRGGDFTMRNVKIHHNKISKTGGEGLYIGGTNPAGHDLDNVEIYENEITDTGWDGMQLGNCVSGASIHDNRITRTGTNIKRPQDEPQDNGIQIGDRTKGVVMRNKIRDARGNGIICLGTGVHMYLNQIYNAGESGIYADDRIDTLEGFRFTENLIMNPKVHCIALHANKGLVNEASNNMLLNPGSIKMLQGSMRSPFIEKDELVICTERNNYMEDEPSFWRNMRLSDYYANR